MKWLTFKYRYEPGVRINLMDILLLFVVSLASYILYLIIPEPRVFLMPLYIGVTFFLFCTVFKVTWYDEVFWYLPFAIIMPYALLNVENFWFFILAVFEPIRAAVVIHRMKKGPYVGIFYKWIDNYGSYTPLTPKEKAKGLLGRIRSRDRQR
jgi:hypothetical protein